MTDLYRIRPADIWVQARDDYLSGLSAETVCRRHDLGLSAFRRRARRYGWRRSDKVEPPPGEMNLTLYEDLTVEEQIRTARLRFLQALEIGRATEARRWRRLWVELCDARHALNAEFMAGMTPEEIAADLADHAAADETEEEARLLTAPRLPGPEAPELCTKVHSKILPPPEGPEDTAHPPPHGEGPRPPAGAAGAGSSACTLIQTPQPSATPPGRPSP